MSDIAQLETQISAEIAAAADAATLEALRVAALGKSGSISALLKTLGAMSPEERKTKGPEINGLKDRVGAALAARTEGLTYSRFIHGLEAAGIDMDRKVLADIAGADPAAFKAIADKVRAALA